MKKSAYFFTLIVVIGVFLIKAHPILGQTLELPAPCGSTNLGEFKEPIETHRYIVDLEAGDSLTAVVKPIGDFLPIRIEILGPTENIIYDEDYFNFSQTGTVSTKILSASGPYIIAVYNWKHSAMTGGAEEGNPGAYTLLVGCQFRDGRSIEPGQGVPTATDQAQTPIPPAGAPSQATVASPQFTGVGFPGLPPVDFSNVVKFNLSSSVPISATLTPGFTNIVGFTLNAEAGDVLDLTYTRLFGNLNLGLVVLFPTDQVYFQSSLVTSESLNTRLTFPVAGQYTVGVFRINLVEPEVPEETAFEITGILNPE